MAFPVGTWLLQGILSHAQQSDFGIFVIHADDVVEIKSATYSCVRDNVLFEAGVFMGSIGPERTILLLPSNHSEFRLRLPTDLEGLLLQSYDPDEFSDKQSSTAQCLARIRSRVANVGRAFRNGYNEIAALKRDLDERELEFDDGTTVPLLTIIRFAASRRPRQWYAATDVTMLTNAMEIGYHESMVDLAYWWLILYGVITFDNVDQWSVGEWKYKNSVDLAKFTERGLVLLNELKADAK